MKTIINRCILLCCLLVPELTFARSVDAERPIVPRRIEVAFNKTVHILFPSAVKYVDLGSAYLLAGKANGAENVIRIKAAVRGFEGETNLSVITDDGIFYSFTAVYDESPSELSIELEKPLQNDPFNSQAAYQSFVRLRETGEQMPLLVKHIMYRIYQDNARPIKTVGSKRSGIQVLLQSIYVHQELFYFHISLRNSSKVDYDVDRIRFRIADRKIARRTAVQETYIEPVRRFNEVIQVKAGETLRNVYVFGKFTIPDDKVLIVDVFEKGGGRHQSFTVQESDLAGARTVEELK